MANTRSQGNGLSFTNPVYNQSFPDPYVLKFKGGYFAYCTGQWNDGRIFGILHSKDLVNWEEVGGAMDPLPDWPPFYWAPEITYSNGKFYLYYSVGNETLMHIRVAVSNRPDGGFIDSGVRLTDGDFAIDAHIFTNDDGSKYLFYATDFLDHTHIGTGIVVDKMTDWFTLEGRPRPVTRAKYDWQVYDPNRKEKGGVRWHTVEGPFILKRKKLYYEMFSGGNWQNPSYGVSFAVTNDINTDEEWRQFSDGDSTLPILRTINEKVIGPGHNSVIRGPNNRELYCVYHLWAVNGRVLGIDRMDFAADRLFVNGATHSPQALPFQPTITFKSAESLQQLSDWVINSESAENKTLNRSSLTFNPSSASYLCEVSFQLIEAGADCSYGFGLRNETTDIIEVSLLPSSRSLTLRWFDEDYKRAENTLILGKDFAFDAVHLLRITVDGPFIGIQLDDELFRFETSVAAVSNQFEFRTLAARVNFSGFALTEGFEDLFDGPNSDLGKIGWHALTEGTKISIEDQQLILVASEDTDCIIFKGKAAEDFEFAVNIRLNRSGGDAHDFGFIILNEDFTEHLRFVVREQTGRFYLSETLNAIDFILPASYQVDNYHQFRFLNIGVEISIWMEGLILGSANITSGKTIPSIFCNNCSVGLELVRLTYL